MRILVFCKIPEPLIDQPDVHVCNSVIYVEVVRNVHVVYEFPRVQIHEHSLDNVMTLNDDTFVAALV